MKQPLRDDAAHAASSPQRSDGARFKHPNRTISDAFDRCLTERPERARQIDVNPGHSDGDELCAHPRTSNPCVRICRESTDPLGWKSARAKRGMKELNRRGDRPLILGLKLLDMDALDRHVASVARRLQTQERRRLATAVSAGRFADSAAVATHVAFVAVVLGTQLRGLSALKVITDLLSLRLPRGGVV